MLRTAAIRQFTLGLVLISATHSVLWGQQAATPSPMDAAKVQIDAFERNLRGAIDSAAGTLSTRVREALPNAYIRLQYETQPIVTGVLLPESGAVFHVLIPAIADVDLKLIEAAVARRNIRPTDPNTRVTNNLVVEPDPNAVPNLLANPDVEYTTLVREALINAVVDHSLALPIPAGQYLTVIADELQTQPASPFNPRSRSLILQLKGEDLIAFRENRITREEARSRIKESKYPN